MKKRNKDLLVVEVSREEKTLFKCNQIYLERDAPSLSRRFTFKGIKPRFRRKLDIEKDFYVNEELEISVIYKNHQDKLNRLTKLKIFPSNHSQEVTKEFWLSGTICTCENRKGYHQGFVDVLLAWQEGKVIEDWFNLSAQEKHNYIVACMCYSGTNNSIIKKDKYVINISLIKEEMDLSYMCSVEFKGDRGFLGLYFPQFQDLFRTLILVNNYSVEGIKLYLLNVDKPYNEEMASFYQEYKKLFEECKFDVVELKSGETIP